MSSAVAAESCKRGNKNGHRGGGGGVADLEDGISMSSSSRARPSRSELGEQGITPSICHILSLFVSVTMFTSSIVLIQSLRSNQAICFVPRFTSNWSSIPTDSNTTLALPHSFSKEENFRQPNDMAWLLKQSRENGTNPCHNMRTRRSILLGLDHPTGAAEGGKNLRLQTDQDHELLLVSYTEDGDRRCSGGDFYETDLSGPRWRSRPPVKDIGDGSYLITLNIKSSMAGLYAFKVVLLFANLHGLDLRPDSWLLADEMIRLRIEFTNEFNSTANSSLQLCDTPDFNRRSWKGRWTRTKSNESCSADDEGRFKCLDPLERCDPPWCEGPLGGLESNGWVYSAHCAFRIFTLSEAWSCLAGKWLFFWGDSNHQDTIRNLLNFILGRHEPNMERTFESTFSNSQNSSQLLKITSHFNGHYEVSGNHLGLASLTNDEYRKRLESYFLPSNPIIPDAVILNSGLHDGGFWANLTHYAAGAEKATTFWGLVWRNSRSEASLRPRLLYRTTVAPAGFHRNQPANPQKMEVYNTVLGEMLVSEFGSDVLMTVDEYDMTFPWHFDNECSDGGHYGRPPSLHSWAGAEKGHQYFVDLMLAHTLLNALCPL
ncbi:hypothetical protein R1flu_022175 [Riccia fluitans]|uniref:Uncharacterized protein n=1 Tax=Riccia fluitans TaxID=41844 RepID=A0ABD1ZRH4_9MARC